ncbi:hypothetical protein [Arcobacter sp. F155]|nr:hypothetical protein [Arcobacter sp. F155]
MDPNTQFNIVIGIVALFGILLVIGKKESEKRDKLNSDKIST